MVEESQLLLIFFKVLFSMVFHAGAVILHTGCSTLLPGLLLVQSGRPSAKLARRPVHTIARQYRVQSALFSAPSC